jgi:hypothetical protein
MFTHMRKSDLLRPLLLLVLSAVITETAVAQNDRKSDTEGFFVNLHLNGSSWDLNDDSEFGELPQESGGGMGLAFGFGASQTVTLFMAFDAAQMSGGEERNDYTLAHFDIGTMITLLKQSSRFRPFGKASFTARTAEFDVDNAGVSTFGAAFSAGAGLMAFLTPRLALTGDAQATWGSMTEITTAGFSVNTSIGARSGRLNLGITWFP